MVLLVATYAKAIEPGAFAEQIRMEGLDFLFPVGAVTLIALALEAGIGTALVLGLRKAWILVPAVALVAFFLFLTGRNYWLVANGLRDAEAACGCFGSLLERTPAEAFWQDLFLLVPPLALAFWGRGSLAKGWPWRRLLAVLVVTSGVVLYAGTNSDLRFVEMAAEVGPDQEREEYLETHDYQVVVHGQRVIDARVYHSEETVTFLILGAGPSQAILLRVRSTEVETVSPEHLLAAEDGTMTFSEAAAFQPSGSFEVGMEGISFQIQGVEVLLQSAPEQDG